MVESQERVVTEETETHTAAPALKQPRTLAQVIASQFKAIESNLATLMQSDEPESVHKMRVATRRLQAALDLLETKEEKAAVRKLKRRLRKWRRELSRVRNYDVFLMFIDQEPSARHPGRRKQYEALRSALQRQRERTIAKARKYFTKVDLAQFATRLAIAPPPLPAAEAEGEPAAEEASKARPVKHVIDPTNEERIAQRAAGRIEQRLSEFQSLAASSHMTNDPQELHQLRIAAKRLRYLFEIVSEMGYGDASRALAGLRTLQDKIGDWHDLESLETEIIGIVSKRKFMKEHLAESSKMLQVAAHLENKKHALVSRLFPVRVPRILPVTSRRLTKALRARSSQEQPGK
jgi:CHAD domain-containing protein